MYIFLAWFFLYWMPGLFIVVHMVRKDRDVTIDEFVGILLATSVLSYWLAFDAWLEHLDQNRKVLFKKSTKSGSDV